MHVLEWRARSNDSVVDVTPGVELWHTLWFMWESPRCPEHQFFTTLSDNCALLYLFGDGTTSRSLLEIYFTFAELDDELQITCQWSAQAKTPLMYPTKRNIFCIFWNHVKRAHKLVQCAQRHTPQYSRLSDGRPGSPFGTFVYLVSHCVWDLLSTCETRSVPVRGEAASWNRADSSPELCERNFTLPHLYNKGTPLPNRNN